MSAREFVIVGPGYWSVLFGDAGVVHARKLRPDRDDISRPDVIHITGHDGPFLLRGTCMDDLTLTLLNRPA